MAASSFFPSPQNINAPLLLQELQQLQLRDLPNLSGSGSYLATLVAGNSDPFIFVGSGLSTY